MFAFVIKRFNKKPKQFTNLNYIYLCAYFDNMKYPCKQKFAQTEIINILLGLLYVSFCTDIHEQASVAVVGAN